MKIEEFTDAAVLIGFSKTDYQLQLEILSLTGKGKSPANKKKREKLKDKYEGKAGKNYAIAFYKLGKNKIEVTDFFRATLVDPKYYVKNLMEKNDIMAIAADEFMLNEIWKSTAKKGTDLGVYKRLVEMLNLFWKDASDLSPQATKEYFDKHVAK